MSGDRTNGTQTSGPTKGRCPPLAQQTGATPPEREIFSRWGWVEPCVWTTRMLTTLEQGVEGGTRPLAERLLRGTGVVQSAINPCVYPSILTQVNHQPESRMREICTSGSEGGGTQTNESSLPLYGVSTPDHTASPRTPKQWHAST